MSEGSNGTVSEAKSSAEPPRRVKRNTTVMSSSSNEDDLRIGVSDTVADVEGAEAGTRAETKAMALMRAAA